MKTVTPQAAVALVRHSNGSYLLVKRASNIPGGGYWCPVSGKPETTESLKEAAVREVKEEVGLSVRAFEEIYRCATSDGSYDLVWFRCEPFPPDMTDIELTLDPDEVAEAGWFSLEEALSLSPMFEATRTFFQKRAPHSPS